MFEIYFCGEDLDSMDEKRKQFENEKYKIVYGAEYTHLSQAAADEKKDALIKSGCDVIILRTREFMYILSKKRPPETEG